MVMSIGCLLKEVKRADHVVPEPRYNQELLTYMNYLLHYYIFVYKYIVSIVRLFKNRWKYVTHSLHFEDRKQIWQTLKAIPGIHNFSSWRFLFWIGDVRTLVQAPSIRPSLPVRLSCPPANKRLGFEPWILLKIFKGPEICNIWQNKWAFILNQHFINIESYSMILKGSI